MFSERRSNYSMKRKPMQAQEPSSCEAAELTINMVPVDCSYVNKCCSYASNSLNKVISKYGHLYRSRGLGILIELYG